MRELLIAAAALMAAACGQASDDAPNVVAEPNVVEGGAAPQRASGQPQGVELFSDNDVAMNRAIAEAQRTLPDFLRRLAAGELDGDHPMIKVGLETPGGGLEHIWTSDPRVDGDRLTGVLANDPYELTGVQRGSTVTFTRDQVSDWGYTRGERLWGNFSTRVMVDRLEPAQAAEIRAALSPTPLEP